jgi:hypothetical protein
MRTKFWIEVSLAATSGFLCVLTLLWRDWIEAIFHIDPDQQSGAMEWLVVAALLAATAAFSMRARAKWGRLAATG